MRRRDALLLATFAALRPTRSLAAPGPALPFPMTEVAPGIHVRQGVHEEATVENQDGIANVGTRPHLINVKRAEFQRLAGTHERPLLSLVLTILGWDRESMLLDVWLHDCNRRPCRQHSARFVHCRV